MVEFPHIAKAESVPPKQFCRILVTSTIDLLGRTNGGDLTMSTDSLNDVIGIKRRYREVRQ